ncbi:pilus assembly protein PilX [Pseudomonas fluorescens]|uniref:Pilus assembly protein PilX n=1 Tax=Pseudomonas lactucae TaxID=2813360 RepID=A0A9X1C4K0_9PSED|nr:PilX N-terminal domain-containing pilus assembly protein [Pseudomonas lactucae]OPA97761.1 pilus assembly protein PilX [Pseudomonas fluorescens]MBN2974722.1 pilus assembly protein PilX [Pseudomonas lactucae]MBN2987292.1 pilus assembly protein PilX [Pseudomonas lactucae]OPB13762.1 pilus assembly protein PilX [Pseudomonas fluorescens]OPB27392.1 pilus assembly protein PilX [Pseudomonas fluorescens]
MEFFNNLHSLQRGMALLISLVFLLLLSLLGLSSMQGAVAQQKVSGSFWQRNQSLQAAESGLRRGEGDVRRAGGIWPRCSSVIACAPPPEAFSVVGAGTNPVSTVTWFAFKGGVYAVQSLGPGVGVANLPPRVSARLYRVTAVGLSGQSRTVLESLYAQVEEEGDPRFRRVSWRQLQ